MNPEIVELAEMYEQGAWSSGDYFHRITLLVPSVSTDEVVLELPAAHRDGFVSWLRETYDNEVPTDHFVSIGHRDDDARTRERISGLRSWLRANRD